MSSPSSTSDSKSLLHSKPRTGGLRLSRRRGRRMPIIRLGGGGGGGRRSWRSGGKLLLCGFLQRVRVRWVSAQCSRFAKRLRALYAQAMKDIAEGAATMEAVQARILLETYFSVPVMSVPVTNYSRW